MMGECAAIDRASSRAAVHFHRPPMTALTRNFRLVVPRTLAALLLAAGAACTSGSSSAGSAGATAAPRASRQPCATQPDQPYFEFQVERPVRVTAASTAPRVAAPADAPQEYTAQFIVTPAGVIDSASFRLLDPKRAYVDTDGGRRFPPVTDSSLVTAAWTHLSLQRFSAAEIRGCTVPQLVQQNIVLPTSAAQE